jgi:hypothetical protein
MAAQGKYVAVRETPDVNITPPTRQKIIGPSCHQKIRHLATTSSRTGIEAACNWREPNQPEQAF